MAENSTFEEQWTLLRKETGMEDAPLRQKLEHFIFRQYGRVVLVHYVKALSALELSHHFYLRFRRRSRSVAEPILYWTSFTPSSVMLMVVSARTVQ